MTFNQRRINVDATSCDVASKLMRRCINVIYNLGNDVASTFMRRINVICPLGNDVALTLLRHCINVMCWLGKVILPSFQNQEKWKLTSETYYQHSVYHIGFVDLDHGLPCLSRFLQFHIQADRYILWLNGRVQRLEHDMYDM